MSIQSFNQFLKFNKTSPAFTDKLPEVISEAISVSNLEAVSKIVSSYLSRKLNVAFHHYPEIEQFKNSSGHGFGVRFFFGTKSIRFNWETSSVSASSASLSSVDIWEGNGPAIDYHLEFDNAISLVKSLPIVLQFLKDPKLGVFEYNTETALHEFITDDEMIIESEDPKYDEVVSSFKNDAQIVTQGMKPASYQIFLAIRKEFPEHFKKEGNKTIFIGDSSFFKKNQATVCEKIGRVKVRVTRGASSEVYTPSAEVKNIEDNKEKLSYEMQLKDLANLTRLVVTGASNALFVGGRSGIGKTHTVETTLASMGLHDGEGYFKNTGTASPVGIYILLYEHRNGIVLFDDSDGALADQDGRNLIKAATDTKKVRKLAWTKKSSSFIDPDDYDENDPEPNTYPKYFDFKGRIIFISNLSVNKLDPDGALRTRSLLIDISPEDMEIIEFMRKLAPTFTLAEGMNLSVKERTEVVEILATSKSKNSLSLRKLERALNIRASLGGEGSDWKRIITLYA